MAMFLVLFGISFVLAVITVVLLSALLRSGESAPVVRKTPRPPDAPGFFDSEVPAVADGTASAVPVEALLLEIERHVRLERAAAESFHVSPTPESLHVHTASRLVH